MTMTTMFSLHEWNVIFVDDIILKSLHPYASPVIVEKKNPARSKCAEIPTLSWMKTE